MSLTFVLATCLFVAVVGVVVACVDRWRDSRLAITRRVQGVRVPVVPVSPVPAAPPTRKRAA